MPCLAPFEPNCYRLTEAVLRTIITLSRGCTFLVSYTKFREQAVVAWTLFTGKASRSVIWFWVRTYVLFQQPLLHIRWNSMQSIHWELQLQAALVVPARNLFLFKRPTHNGGRHWRAQLHYAWSTAWSTVYFSKEIYTRFRDNTS